MNGGAKYIYDNIYMSLLRGEDVKLSQINMMYDITVAERARRDMKAIYEYLADMLTEPIKVMLFTNHRLYKFASGSLIIFIGFFDMRFKLILRAFPKPAPAINR